MAKGSAANGLLGMLGGVLLALLAIFIGYSSVGAHGGAHEGTAAHEH